MFDLLKHISEIQIDLNLYGSSGFTKPWCVYFRNILVPNTFFCDKHNTHKAQLNIYMLYTHSKCAVMKFKKGQYDSLIFNSPVL